MDITRYRQKTRTTWAETFFGDAFLELYRTRISNIADTLDSSLDSLKKHLFYGDNGAVTGDGDHNSFNDLDLSRGEKDLLHAVLGIATEAGELLEAIEPLLQEDEAIVDTVNIDEEMGDLYYYMMRMHDALDSYPAGTMDRNLAKLLERYDSGEFNTEDALNRDTGQERQALES